MSKTRPKFFFQKRFFNKILYLKYKIKYNCDTDNKEEGEKTIMAKSFVDCQMENIDKFFVWFRNIVYKYTKQ